MSSGRREQSRRFRYLIVTTAILSAGAFWAIVVLCLRLLDLVLVFLDPCLVVQCSPSAGYA